MKVDMVRAIQQRLKDLGHYKGPVDGDRGPGTSAAVLAALSERDGELPEGWRGWSKKRKAVAYLQLYCADEGIDAGAIDGWIGPQTRFGHRALAEKLATGEAPSNWRDDTPLDVNPHGWPRQSQVEDFYGPHGQRGGHSPPLQGVECPWTLKIAWNKNQTIRKIWIHQRCAESLARILEKVHAHYGESEIRRLGLDLYGGSYNPRRMRGSERWSMHAWAIAIDWAPEDNRLHWNRQQASLAGPEYQDWWRFWEEGGWLSLGRARNFDWMHVQAAKL